MKQRTQFILTGSLVLSASFNVAVGGTTESPVVETSPPASPWSFEGSMYGWLTGLDGDIGFDVSLNESFLDMVDGFYVDLATGRNPLGPLYTRTRFRSNQQLETRYSEGLLDGAMAALMVKNLPR